MKVMFHYICVVPRMFYFIRNEIDSWFHNCYCLQHNLKNIFAFIKLAVINVGFKKLNFNRLNWEFIKKYLFSYKLSSNFFPHPQYITVYKDSV